MDAFGVLERGSGDYENFVKGFLEIKDDQIRSKVEKEISDGLLWPGAVARAEPRVRVGVAQVTELVGQVLDPEATAIFRRPVRQRDRIPPPPGGRLEIANRRESYALDDRYWIGQVDGVHRADRSRCARARARGAGHHRLSDECPGQQPAK